MRRCREKQRCMCERTTLSTPAATQFDIICLFASASWPVFLVPGFLPTCVPTPRRATVDDTPWLQAMKSWVGWSYAGYFATSYCSTAYVALASERAKMQLLPALKILDGQEAPLPSTEVMTNTTGRTVCKTSASTSTAPVTTTTDSGGTGTKEYSTAPPTSACPSSERIESLLVMLDSRSKQSETSMVARTPSLRMTFPIPGGRVSGGLVSFIGEVHLGPALPTNLMAKGNIISRSLGTKRLTADQRRLEDIYQLWHEQQWRGWVREAKRHDAADS